MIVTRLFVAIDLSLDCLGRGLGGEQMLYSFRRDHASVSSVGKKTKRLIAIVGFTTLLASRRSAIRDLGVSQKLWSVGSNRGPETHRTRPPAGKRDGRAGFIGSQCICIISLSHGVPRRSIGCRKHRAGDHEFRGDPRAMEILVWS